MGGGSGITWQVTLDCFETTVRRSRNKRGKVVVVWLPKIERWEAIGYQDGMSNIKPDLLKVIDFGVPDLGDEDWDYWHSNYFQGRDRDEEAAVSSLGPFKCITWPGYSRGKWQNLFPMELAGEVHVEGLGDIDAWVLVEPVDLELFGYWYEDVFQTYEWKDEEGNDDWDGYWDFLEDNYGLETRNFYSRASVGPASF